jgi:hypothetical protein
LEQVAKVKKNVGAGGLLPTSEVNMVASRKPIYLFGDLFSALHLQIGFWRSGDFTRLLLAQKK